MRLHNWHYGVIVFAALLAALLIYAAAVQSTVQIDSTNLRVYRDGLVHVEQTLLIGEFAPQAAVTLFTEENENLIVLDENQLAVDYQLEGKNLEIYALGANKVKISYDINTLTARDNGLWTLNLENPYDSTVIFPANSTIIYLSATPNRIDTGSNQLTLSIGAGQWEISYLLEIGSSDQTNPIPTQVFNNTLTVPLEYLAVIIAVIIVVVILIVFMAKRKHQPNIKKTLNSNPQLMNDDKAVLEFLAEKGGHAFEAEIRQRFPDMPRTSLWRLIKRLEKNEIVEVNKIGLENQVSLKK
jgi:uncharacterized membrane protein